MTPERAQEIFNAVRLHLISNYDFHKYNGKCQVGNISPGCEFISMKIEDETKLTYFNLCNQLAYHSKNGRFCGFAAEIYNHDGMKIFKDFVQKLKNLDVTLKIEVGNFLSKKTVDDFTDIQEMVYLYHGGKMSLFTIIHIFKFLNVENEWAKSNDPLSQELLQVVKKTSPFLKFKKEKIMNLIDTETIREYI